MELLGSTIPVWIALVLGALLCLYMYLTWTFDTFHKMGLQNPKPLPLFGNLLDFASKSSADLALYNTRTYGRVYGTFFGRTPSLTANDVELVKEVTVKQFSNFPDRRSGSSVPGRRELDYGLTRIEGEHWKHVRSQLTPVFTSGKLKMMQPLIDNCVDGLVTELEATDGAAVLVKERMGAFTLATIASTGFGLSVDSQKNLDKEPFVKHAKAIMNISFTSPVVLLMLLVPPLARVLAYFGYTMIPNESLDYFVQAMQAKMNSVDENWTHKDFIQQALQKKVDLDKEPSSALRTSGSLRWSVNGLTDMEILSNAMTFFLAGYDTTANLLTYALFSLANHRDVLERLREEVMLTQGPKPSYEELIKMDYLEWVINETLRMYPPAVFLERKCVQETTLGGLKIPKGMMVNFSAYAIHMDPEYWPDPCAFKPERYSPENKPDNFAYIWLPFGAGPRNCIGMRLALLEAKAALAQIVRRFDITLAENCPTLPLKFQKGRATLMPEQPISLHFTPLP